MALLKKLVLVVKRRWILLSLFPLALIMPLASANGAEGESWFSNLISSSLSNIGFYFLSKVAFGISWIVSMVAGIVVIIEAYALQWILKFSLGIISTSPIIQYGLPVMLSLANLAFVLGMIVVAIATILRIESYGLKSVLWKLIVVAIAVNFGLVIAGTILGFSDNITNSMVTAINPGENGGGITGFASDMAGAFNPQNTFKLSADNMAAKDIQTYQDALNATGGQVGAVISLMISPLLTLAGLLIVIVILGATVIMLIYRYIKVSFLIMLLPVQWAAWPFPAFKEHATKWWKDFIKQAFFPIPLVFFLWLGIMMAHAMSDPKSGFGTFDIAAQKGSILASVVGILGNMMVEPAKNLLKLALLGGIMGFGLIAAEKMGASFAKNAQNAIKAGQGRVKKELATRVARTGKRVGLKAQQRVGVPLQKGWYGMKGAAQRFNEATRFGGKPSKVEAENVVMKDGKPDLKMLGKDAAGKQGVWQDVAVDAQGKTYADFTKNSAGFYIDRKTGKTIDGAAEKKAFVTKDGEVLNKATFSGRGYVTDAGTILTEADLQHERGGKVAVNEAGQVLADFLSETGELQAKFADAKGRALEREPSSYFTKKKMEGVEKNAEEISEELENLWRKGKESTGILFAIPAAMIGGAAAGLKEGGTYKKMKTKDVLDMLAKSGMLEDYHPGEAAKGESKPAAPGGAGGTSPAPAH